MENNEIQMINTPRPIMVRGDCIDYLKNLKDNSIDLIITDPPYKITAQCYKRKSVCPDRFLSLTILIVQSMRQSFTAY